MCQMEGMLIWKRCRAWTFWQPVSTLHLLSMWCRSRGSGQEKPVLGTEVLTDPQISPLATPPSDGHGSAGQLTLTSVPIQDPDLQFKWTLIQSHGVFPNPELWNPNRISSKSSVRQWLIKPLVWNGGSWFWMKMLNMWDPGFLIFTRQQILPRRIICLHSKSPEW